MNCYETIKQQIKTLFFNNNKKPTKSDLEKKLPIYEEVSECNLTKNEKLNLIKEIISENEISIPIGTTIIKKGWQPWLHTLENRSRYYADRYRWYLLHKQNFPINVVNQIFKSNDNILDYLENPNRDGIWIKKGLIMGYVQSGKTANYLALINKAADVGYKLIILIAGIHNNLREQTQKRVNDGFIGFDNLTREYIGVSNFSNKRVPGSLTSTLNDFKRTNLQSLGINPKDYNEPIILVIKKNYHTLNNILDWLKGTTQQDKLSDYPMLLIDDEADNASVNTKKDPNQATKINQQIREILNLFHKRCYVGYTATPFANIFINPSNNHDEFGEDLFPEDFIISLEAPSNYIGAKKIFLDEGYDILREIKDNEEFLPVKHSKEFIVEELPKSLYEAIIMFLLSSAIKKLKKVKNRYSSMLINVSFRIDTQNQILDMVYEFVQNILNKMRFNYTKTLVDILKDEELNQVFFIWEKEYKGLESFSFETILEQIVKDEEITKVYVINSRKKTEQLKYDDYKESGLNAIAIGGYSLSRGFTLEGLTISYFLRNTMMYDTLLQMGRWFGYRDGYEKLCRVYMKKDAIEWYGYISEVVEELKEELKIMEYHKLSPRDYGLKIKDHPESLIVTARNKMYNAKDAIVDVCYSNQLIETRVLDNKQDSITNNLNLVKEFVLNLDKPIKYKNNSLWENVDVNSVLSFINNFRNHPQNIKTDTFALSDYISKGKEEELKFWDIALINIEKNEKFKLNKKLIIGKEERGAIIDNDIIIVSGNNHRVGQPSDEKIGLSKDRIEKAKRLAIELKKEEFKRKNLTLNEIKEKLKKVKPIGNHYREFRVKPLLILHILKIRDKTTKEFISEYDTVLAYGISFPKINSSDLCSKNRKGMYKVNERWWQQHYGQDIEELEYEE